jgi:hypothetical protein
MTTKDIVDQHFTANTKYYESLCKYLFKGRYLWEDLYQETYLALLNCPAVTRHQTNSYLLGVGTNVAKGIWQKRTSGKYHCDGKDSPLFETAGAFNCPELIEYPKEYEIQKQNDHMNEIKALVFKGLEEKDFDMEVFVMGQIESINAMSHRTGISRYLLNKANEKAKDHIKKNIAA